MRLCQHIPLERITISGFAPTVCLTGRYDRCIAVHLKASAGRLSAKEIGYSHLANHRHFLRKGVSSLPCPWNYARFVALCFKLALLAILGMHRVESREKLQGYSAAICDILPGRSRPSRISDGQT